MIAQTDDDLPVPPSSGADLPLPPLDSTDDELPPPPAGGDEPPLSPGGDLPPPPGDDDSDSDDAPLAIPLEGGEKYVPTNSLPDDMEVDLDWFGKMKVEDVGMPIFTIAVGLVDGFNPCAMWVLMFLLSMLVNLKDRRRMFMIAGLFVLISGLAYFLFMVLWVHFFLLFEYSRTIQIAIGVLATTVGLIHVKDFFALKKGVSLSIPESAKPGINTRIRKIITAESLWTAMIGASILAILINILEFACTAGLPTVYTSILTSQGYPAWKNYAYLGLYNVAYMFDDSVMVIIAVVTLGKRKLQEKEGRWLKLVSGSLILILGLLLLFKPEWLQW